MEWLDAEHVQGAIVPQVSPIENMAVDMVRMMGNRVDWAGVPVLAFVMGCDDLDTLFPLLEVARDHVSNMQHEPD